MAIPSAATTLSSVNISPSATVDLDATYRKIAWRIMPFLMLCYVVAYLDRVNVGFAKLDMMRSFTDFNPGTAEAVYGLGAGLFFVGYFLFEIPSNLILHRVGAKLWIARIMITWGLISGAFAWVDNRYAFYAMRFLLGAAEAGFYPGVILYLTYWFPSHRRAKMVAVFMAAIPVSGIFGNPLSGWIMKALENTHGWAGWQWMFMIEAVPAVLVGIAVIFYLDNGIRKAKWLSEEEKVLIEKDIALHQAPPESHTSGEAVRAVFRSGFVWLCCAIYFCFVMGQYAITFWLPTLVKASGISDKLMIGVYAAIPNILTVIVMILVGRSADRMQERRWHLVVPAMVGAVGFSAAAAIGASNPMLGIIALSFAAAGAITCAPLFWSLPTALMSGTVAAAGIALINSVGNLAGYASPNLIGMLSDATGNTEVAMYVIALSLVIGSALVLTTPADKVNR